jgi:hypothetical protein
VKINKKLKVKVKNFHVILIDLNLFTGKMDRRKVFKKVESYLLRPKVAI